MQNLHYIDLIIIFGYLAICLILGFFKIGHVKTMKQYALGVGSVSTTMLVATMFATLIGAGSTMGVIGKVYGLGITFSIALMFEAISWVITAKVFGNNIEQFKGCLSLGDIMESLYGKCARWIMVIAAILQSIGIIAAQILALGYVFNYFLGIPFSLGVFIGFGILTFYSAFGGIRAVALTDILQFFVFYCAIFIASLIIYNNAGGYQNLFDNLPSTHLNIDFTNISPWLFLSLAFNYMLPHSEPTFIQRFLMAPNTQQLVKSLFIVGIITIPFIMFLSAIGLALRVSDFGGDSNTIFFHLISNYLPISIKGLMIAGIMAIIMSTADSFLNTVSVLCAHDVAKQLFPQLKDNHELLIARISTFLVCILSALLAAQGNGFIELIWLADNFWAPLIIVPLIAGFLRFKTNYKSFICSNIFAIVFSLIGVYITGELATITLFLGVVGSALGFFGMYFWQKFITSPINIDFLATTDFKINRINVD
jgi:Na+/proline symporter